jgi:hypothetical protein
MVESLNTDLLSHINAVMLDWYVRNEFKNAPKQTKIKGSTKPKSKGASRAVRRKQPVQAQTSQESS